MGHLPCDGPGGPKKKSPAEPREPLKFSKQLPQTASQNHNQNHHQSSKTIVNMPSPTHLISKVGDPIFALFIGLSAAATRINREEKELGHSTKETIDAGFR
jgi:hypothetical protein